MPDLYAPSQENPLSYQHESVNGAYHTPSTRRNQVSKAILPYSAEAFYCSILLHITIHLRTTERLCPSQCCTLLEPGIQLHSSSSHHQFRGPGFLLLISPCGPSTESLCNTSSSRGSVSITELAMAECLFMCGVKSLLCVLAPNLSSCSSYRCAHNYGLSAAQYVHSPHDYSHRVETVTMVESVGLASPRGECPHHLQAEARAR